jgi:hypothetical protein
VTRHQLATQFGVLPWSWHLVLLALWCLRAQAAGLTSATAAVAALQINHHRRAMRAWYRRVRRGA